jgi:exodeoxyribonuclease VII small subunit
MTYNEAYTELKDIINSLESSDVDIEDLCKKIEKAKELIALCKTKLAEVEIDIEALNNKLQEL